MKTIRDILGAIAATIAVVAFVFSVATNYMREKENDIRTWQKTVVFDIVTQSTTPSVTFANIRQKYVTEASAYEDYDMPNHELSPASTRRILLELIRDRALIPKNNDSYSISDKTANPVIDETLEILRKTKAES